MWEILATLLLETFAGENSKKFANIVMATKDQLQDSSRKPPIKKIMNLLRQRINLKVSDQVQFFKGARLCSMGTACLIWKIQRSARSLNR